MIGALIQLLRPKLALLNAVTAVGGYLLFPAMVKVLPLSAVFCGVALLASGGSAINQVLELDLDRLMKRTKLRPLPQGVLSPFAATLIGTGLILVGLALLGVVGNLKSALLGAAALMWYLAVYTPLKRHTSFALMIGAICGALPPVIGWGFAGGYFFDYQIVLIYMLLYIWQIPHFWLLQRRHADDYRNAGIPLFGASETDFGFMKVWIMALITAAMLLPVFGIIGKHVSVLHAALLLPLFILTILRREKTLFTLLNLFPLFYVVCIFMTSMTIRF